MTAWHVSMRWVLGTLLVTGIGGELFAQQPSSPLRADGSLFPRPISAGSNPLELAFAGPDDKAADAKKPAANVKRIELPTWSTGTKADAWDDYFRRNDAPEAAVRETVRALMAEKKHDEVIGLIEGAIRQKQAQPWMYEALGIAMQMSARPAADIERVMMSAIDFSRGPQDLVRVAYYLSHWMPDDRALAQRALKLYRQATEQAPLEAEIFTHSLELAKRWDDLDAIEWSCEGILRFPWPHSQRHIPEHADQVATTKLNELLKASEVDRAAAFKRKMDAARMRDCVIRVSWIGTADLDLLVEDPSGSVCTYHQPRSSGGGVLIRDNQTGTVDARDETTKFEEYVCAAGFDGRYRMQVRRVWGKVNGNKVSIDFWTRRGTPEEVRQRQVLELKDDELVVAFDMAGGRRTSSDSDPRLVNTINYQIEVGKSLLAQQLNVPSLAVRGDQLPVTDNNRRNLWGAQAGYRPVIITLPTGANLQATAVVSNDRRYVRISAQPIFTSIPTVNVYNFATGGQYTYAPNAPNSGGPPNSAGTPGACAASSNPRSCAATPPVTGYVALLHPNKFLGNGACATLANPFVDEAGDFVTPDWTPTPRTPPRPTVAPMSVLLGSLNGLPAINIPKGKVLRTKIEQVTGFTGVHVFMLGIPPNTFPGGGPSWDVLVDYSNQTTDTNPANVPPFPSATLANGGIKTFQTANISNTRAYWSIGTQNSGGFQVYLDQRPRAGIDPNGFAMTEHNGGPRPIDSLMLAVGLRAPLPLITTTTLPTPEITSAYFGRTNSQDAGSPDGNGATRTVQFTDMFDFAFRDTSNPNGGPRSAANVGPAFRHVPLPITYDPLLDNSEDNTTNWGVYDSSFSYRFYKSNAAWESWPRADTGIKLIPDPAGALPTTLYPPGSQPLPQPLLGPPPPPPPAGPFIRLFHPSLRDTTVPLLVPDPMRPAVPAATVDGKPRTGRSGYWPQNERNRTPPPQFPPPFTLLGYPTGQPILATPANPEGNLHLHNRYDEWFPIPQPTRSPTPDVEDLTRPAFRNSTFFPPFVPPYLIPVANIPPLVSPAPTYVPLQDSGPGFVRNRFRRISIGGAVDLEGDLLNHYSNRQDEFVVSIVVIYPRVLTFDEANRVATWINCWGGAVSYDRSADPRTATITDDRRVLQTIWPYTIP